jgi:hypothetical protein
MLEMPCGMRNARRRASGPLQVTASGNHHSAFAEKPVAVALDELVLVISESADLGAPAFPASAASS